MWETLKKIQRAGEGTKRLILIAGSAVAMAAVVAVWLLYFNNILASAAPAPDTAAEGSAASPSGGFSFWETMRRGVSVLGGEVKNGFGWVAGALNAPREYIVKPTR